MGRMYACVFNEVAVTAAQDCFEIVAPADSCVLLHYLTLSQSSDAGDVQSEMLNILIHRGITSGAVGATITPRPMQSGDSAYGGSVEVNNTTQGNEGNRLWAESFNVLNGLSIIWTPETRPVVSPSGRIIIELQTTPADELTMSGTLIIEEIGG